MQCIMCNIGPDGQVDVAVVAPAVASHIQSDLVASVVYVIRELGVDLAGGQIA